jgi:hypothetical protein
MKQPTIVLALAVLAGAACGPKKDTAKPDGDQASCTEEAKQCPDGSTVEAQGPDCQFPACPGEGEGEPEPSKDEGEGDAEPAADADKSETPPAEGE